VKCSYCNCCDYRDANYCSQCGKITGKGLASTPEGREMVVAAWMKCSLSPELWTQWQAVRVARGEVA